MTKRSSWSKYIFLIIIFVVSFRASAADALEQVQKYQQRDEEIRRQKLENEAGQQQLEQQRLQVRRQQEEYERQQKERNEQQQKQKSLELRLDEMQKRMDEQDALQKQLLESKAREEALRKENEALKKGRGIPRQKTANKVKSEGGRNANLK